MIGALWWLLKRGLLSRIVRWLLLVAFGLLLAIQSCIGSSTQLLLAADVAAAGPGSQSTATPTLAPGQPTPTPGPLPPPPTTGGGFVSPLQVYGLALSAGWNAQDSITSTAISLAEDGSGNPSVASPPNTNGTIDLGLWQINSSHWADCGGRAALTVPINNATCAYSIWLRQHWCAWSTYGDYATCHVNGHNNAYLSHLSCATLASQGAAAANYPNCVTPY